MACKHWAKVSKRDITERKRAKIENPYLNAYYLKSGIEEFHRKYVLVPADKAANNVVVV